VSTPPTRYRNGAEADERFGLLARDYADALSRADPLADAALEAIHALGRHGAELFEQALSAGIDTVEDAPPELQALFADLASPPFEVDHERIDRGARALGRCGFLYSVATKQALYWGYSSGAAVKPLAWTGEMCEPDAALRRLTETASWALAVVRPGQLHRDAPAWHGTVRVRLVHARVRRALRASDRWDDRAWGAPINQADQAMTVLEFCHLPLRMLRLLGVRFDEDELDGVRALWRYVGHLIGVPASINPAGEAESSRLFELIELTRDPPDADSIALVAATLGSTHVGATGRVERLSASALETLERALAWHHLPDGQLERLRFPTVQSRGAVPVLSGAVRAGEALRGAVPGADTGLLSANNLLNDRLVATLRRRAARTSGGARRPNPIAQPPVSAQRP
jgi:ER-bound oxygenase mpaB/B'/Rubber oxygenase, catalytic domain